MRSSISSMRSVGDAHLLAVPAADQRGPGDLGFGLFAQSLDAECRRRRRPEVNCSGVMLILLGEVVRSVRRSPRRRSSRPSPACANSWSCTFSSIRASIARCWTSFSTFSSACSREAQQDHAHAIAHVGLRDDLVVDRGDHAVDHLAAWRTRTARWLSRGGRNCRTRGCRCSGKADREKTFHPDTLSARP